MRILECIWSFGGGGAERQLSLLVRELVRRGHDVHVAYVLGGIHEDAFLSSGAVLHRLRPRMRYDATLVVDLILLMRRLRPDVVQTWLTQMDILAGTAAKVSGIPWVLSERASAGVYHDLMSRVRSRLGMHAASIVANSEGGLDYWRGLEFNRNGYVVRNAVFVQDQDAPVSDPELHGWFSDCGNIEHITFAGRYDSEKNVGRLLSAFIMVLSERPQANAVMFGEGPLKAQLLARRRALDESIRSRILIHGYTDRLPYFLRRSSVFVSVSLFEGHPNTVLEAATVGCPLVLSDISAHREFLNDESAWWASATDEGAIAEAIVGSLDNKEESTRKAGVARRQVECFTIAACADRYEKIYGSLMNRRKG